MLKWLAVWTAFIGNGPPADVVDDDGPGRFATEQECVEHLNTAAPKIVDILNRYTSNLDVMVLGECVEDNELPKGISR